jgi:Phosphoadenosine phosphosulfate reductase family
VTRGTNAGTSSGAYRFALQAHDVDQIVAHLTLIHPDYYLRMQEMQERQPIGHVLSYGGGVNSVALMVMLVKAGRPLDEVVFADTGAEVPETYAYLDVTKEFLNGSGVAFTALPPAGRHGGLYETAWHRRVIPSAVWRWSTRDFKVGPLHRHYRQLYERVVQYLGIAYDEVERMRPSGRDTIENVYPLVDERVTRERCVEIIREAGLPIPVKSGCFFCPFNNLDRWAWLCEEHPDLFDRAVALEERSKHFPRQRLTDQVYRNRSAVPLRALRQAFAAGKEPALMNREVPCGGECLT